MKTQLKTAEYSRNELAHPIPRVDISSLTPETFFVQYQKTGTPVVITGLLQDERDWDLDYLCEQLGEREFFCRYYGRERYQQDRRYWTNIGSGVKLQKLPFQHYAEILRNRQAHEKDIYLGKGSLKNTSLADTPSLKTIGQKLGLKPATEFKLYMGPSRHTTSLHYDIADATLVQLHGTKKLVLFPPTQTHNLYPFSIYVHWRSGLRLRCCYSQVCLENPDFHLFPNLAEALQEKHEAILNQGEILYIPAVWWHEVTTLGDDEMVCSVNRNWHISPTSRALGSWARWRPVIGNILALPYLLKNLLFALFSKNRQEEIQKIFYRL